MITTPTPTLRPDVQALLDTHLAGIDGAKLTDVERMDRYRSFRSQLHDICGCTAADPSKRDNGLFLRAIAVFCRGILL